jgi:excisionase family DNA binding protein
MQVDTATAKPRGRRPRDKSIPRTFTPLTLETRTHVTTEEAAHYLNLSRQTLRAWACFETGRIRPHRIPGVNGLYWPVSEIRRVLGLEVVQ